MLDNHKKEFTDSTRLTNLVIRAMKLGIHVKYKQSALCYNLHVTIDGRTQHCKGNLPECCMYLYALVEFIDLRRNA
jgi:hypothetical protein